MRTCFCTYAGNQCRGYLVNLMWFTRWVTTRFSKHVFTHECVPRLELSGKWPSTLVPRLNCIAWSVQLTKNMFKHLVGWSIKPGAGNKTLQLLNLICCLSQPQLKCAVAMHRKMHIPNTPETLCIIVKHRYWRISQFLTVLLLARWPASFAA